MVNVFIDIYLAQKPEILYSISGPETRHCTVYLAQKPDILYSISGPKPDILYTVESASAMASTVFSPGFRLFLGQAGFSYIFSPGECCCSLREFWEKYLFGTVCLVNYS